VPLEITDSVSNLDSETVAAPSMVSLLVVFTVATLPTMFLIW
jgi:hypothetical protein